MNMIRAVWLVSMLLAATASAAAPPPPSVRIRGDITAFNGEALKVHTRDGKALTLQVPGDAKINMLSPLTLRDIKPGAFVGVTAILRGGELQALEVHVFPEAMRGTGEGHYAWDLEPGSTMTNANVEAVVAANTGERLTLSYKGGSQQITVPPDTPVITFTPAARTELKPRAAVFVIARRNPDGSLSALRILIGQGHLRPPM